MPDETISQRTDNEALNAMVDQLTAIENFLTGDYDTVTGDSTWRDVTDEKSSARGAQEDAIKTVVTNKGPDAVRVYEDDVLVLIVAPGTTGTVPMGGKGVLEWDCATGE